MTLTVWCMPLAHANDPADLANPISSTLDAYIGPSDPTERNEFEAWKQARFANLDRQRHPASCGAAALANLLTYFHGLPVSEDELLASIGKDGTQPLSMLDIRRMAAHRKVRIAAVRLTYDQLLTLGAASIVRFNTAPGERAQQELPVAAGRPRPSPEPALGHFVIVAFDGPDRVAVKDPSAGNYTLTRSEFIRLWDLASDSAPGIALRVDRESLLAAGMHRSIQPTGED